MPGTCRVISDSIMVIMYMSMRQNSPSNPSVQTHVNPATSSCEEEGREREGVGEREGEREGGKEET